jgi:hypothetical protein
MFFHKKQHKPSHVRNLTDQLNTHALPARTINLESQTENSISFHNNFHSTPLKPTFHFGNNSLTPPPEPTNPRDIPKFNFILGTNLPPKPSATSEANIISRDLTMSFTTLPQGSTNSMTCLQRMMNYIFHDFLVSQLPSHLQEAIRCLYIYVDDLFVFSKTFGEHFILNGYFIDYNTPILPYTIRNAPFPNKK